MYQTSISQNYAQQEVGNRVYCLYRVSTNQQVDHIQGIADIPMQRMECQRFATRMGWEIVHEEQEEGISGHKIRASNRDKIQSIKEAAIAKKFDILLVFMFDRIGRISDETPFVVEWFSKQGIRVWSAKEGEQRFESHTDKLTNYIRFWQADGESEKTSIRTSTRMGQIVEEGHFTGGICPFGYQLVKLGRQNKKGLALNDLVIKEDEVPVVQLIFDKYVKEGFGAQRIANFLNGEGIKNNKGQNWHPGTIRGIIRNITYIGILRSGTSQSKPLEHLMIVDTNIFKRAQEISAHRSKDSADNRSVPLNTKGKSLLAGNVFCGHCGLRLSLTTSGTGRPRSDGTEPRRIRYTCQTKTRVHGNCDGQTGYTMHIVDNAIEVLIHKIFDEVQSFSKSELIRISYKPRVAKLQGKIQCYTDDLKKTEQDLAGFHSEVIKSIRGESDFSSSLLRQLIDETEARQMQIKKLYDIAEGERADQAKMIADLERDCTQILEWSSIYDSSSIAIKKMIVSALIQRVDVHRNYKLVVKFRITMEQFLNGLGIDV